MFIIKNQINCSELRSSDFSVKGLEVSVLSFADHTVSVAAIHLCCKRLYMQYINTHKESRIWPGHINWQLLSAISRHTPIKLWNFIDKEKKNHSGIEAEKVTQSGGNQAVVTLFHSNI